MLNGIRMASSSIVISGIREGDRVAIGIVASGFKEKENRERFEHGLKELIRRKHPSALLIYGGTNSPVFGELEKEGIRIIRYRSETDRRLGGPNKHVEEK